jgi:hypothetical protein
MTDPPPQPRISVIVTLVEGVEALRLMLRALADQEDAPPLEVIVPYDASERRVAELEADHPDVTFVAMGPVETAQPIDGPGGQHELFDRRRAAGLALARGELIAILEDRGVPRRDWARQASALHDELPHAVIGGAVENGRDRPLNWAVYFCDFGRYQLPFEEGARPYVTDVNVCYKRAALDGTRDLWEDRYHETTVHWELLRRGETLYLGNRMVVDQMREGLRLGKVLRERYAWGRLFAYTRAREVGAKRFVLAVGSLILPALLLLRHARLQMRKKVAWGKFARTSPLVLLLLCAWSLGETVGYLTARP